MNNKGRNEMIEIAKTPANNTKYKRSTYIVKELQKILEANKTNKPKNQPTPHFRFYMNIDFMEDEIYYGETLLIEKCSVVNNINPKDIYLFKDSEGEKFIARCKQTKNGLEIVENKPVNSKFYKSYEIAIVGKVIGVEDKNAFSSNITY